MKEGPVILFDGVCNLCNSAVKFVILRDKKAVFRFAALQSAVGIALAQQHGLQANDLQTFVLIEQGKAYTRSTAALRVCRHLNALWPICHGLIIVPRFIRDAVYNWVARNRYKWFGVKEQCMVPGPGIKSRFLS